MNVLFFSGDDYKGFSRSLIANDSLSCEVDYFSQSQKTYYNDSGVLSYTNNIRIDNKDGYSGLRFEGLQANLIQNSDCFTGWDLTSGATSIANNQVSPDGTTNATALTLDSQVDSGIVSNWQIKEATTYTFSVFIKKVSGVSNEVVIGSNNATNWTDFTIKFNLSTETFSNIGSSITRNSFEDIGNGWYRISITGVSNSTVDDFDSFIVINGDISNTGVFAVFGSQVEAKAYPTSLIVSNGLSTIRESDYANIGLTKVNLIDSWEDVDSVANWDIGDVDSEGMDSWEFVDSVDNFDVGQVSDDYTSWYNVDNGSLYLEVKATDFNQENNFIFNFNDTSFNSRIEVKRDNDLAKLIIVNDGVTQVSRNIGSFTDIAKISIRLQDNNIATSINGGAVVIDSVGVVPKDISNLRIGADLLDNAFDGIIKKFDYYAYPLTDSELVGLTV